MFLLKKNLKSCGFYLIRENLAFLLKETQKKPVGATGRRQGFNTLS